MKHRAAFSVRSFLHESVFILLFIEGHNVFRPLCQRPGENTLHSGTACHERSLVNLTVACVAVEHRDEFNLRSFLHENVFILLFISTLTSPRSKHASRGSLLSTNVSLVNLTLACVPEKHRAASNLMSFRHESVFILLFTESHNGFLLFDIALVRAPFTRQSLATNVSVKKKNSGKCP